jgi:hypothetical protein
MELVATAGITAFRYIWHSLQASMHVKIQNQCPGFELTSPAYFSDGAVCDIPLDQRVAPEASVETKFRVDLSRFMFQGVIVYQLSPTSTPSDETNANNTMTEANGDTPMRMEILVAWRISRIHDPLFFILLLERSSNFAWSDKKLEHFLLEEHSNRLKTLKGREEATWIMQNNTVFRTEMDVTSKRHYKLIITISESKQDIHTTNPIIYDPR